MSLADELMAHLQDGGALQQMAAQLGTSPEQAESAVGAALPMLLGKMGANAADPQGAANLFGALQDHGGGGGLDLGSLLGGLLGGAGGGQAGGGAADILGHIFGNHQQTAQDNLGQATGLGGAGAAQLLAMLAPLVMSFLAHHANNNGMDASDLGAALGQEQARAQQQGGIGGGLLGSLLGGGQGGGLSELIQLGGSLLGGGRR
ncbi:MAG: DUF937 domain-containing protein [Acidovorax sp.]